MASLAGYPGMTTAVLVEAVAVVAVAWRSTGTPPGNCVSPRRAVGTAE